MGLVGQLSEIGCFIRAQRIQLRFGDLSRAPLRLLRFELQEREAECDWVSRAADEWDRDIPRRTSDQNASTQALQDAIAVRDLLFAVLAGVDSALFRVFREPVAGELELIIAGTVTREQQVPRYVHSVAMRAKLLGLQFWLEDGILETLRAEEFAMSV